MTDVTRLSDSDLTKEIAFAEGFAFTDPDGVRWLEDLRAEKARRLTDD